MWTSYVILITLMILYVTNPPVATSSFRFYSTLVAMAVLLIINILWDDLKALFPSEEKGIWALLVLSSILAFYTILAGNNSAAIYILFMISAEANAMLPARPAVAFSILLGAGFIGTLIAQGASPEVLRGNSLGLLIGLIFTITLSRVLLRYSEQTERANLLLTQLQQANQELLEARQREKELAIAEDRVRVARDLHDGLGHHLTALSIQLQAAEKLILSRPDMAAEAVRNARGEVQAALTEVRQSVASLREAPVDIQNLPQTIEGLVRSFSQRSSIPARFEQVGDPAPLSAAAGMTLFRVAQEGLTNIQKHAVNPTQVHARLEYTPDEVLLTIEDDGQVPSGSTALQETGFGLPGLRERAAMLGGTLACGPGSQNGFWLTIRLPIQESQGL